MSSRKKESQLPKNKLSKSATRNKHTHETHFHGDVRGPSHTGSGDIIVDKIYFTET